MNEEKFTIRTQSNFSGMFGLGEKVSDGVYLFRDGEYDLMRAEAEALLARKQKAEAEALLARKQKAAK